VTAQLSKSFLGLPNAKIVLASASVARQNILRSAGIDFEILPAAIDESQVRASALADDMMPEDIAVLLASLKAQSVSQRFAAAIAQSSKAFVIGADQILVCDGQIINKPATITAAREQLLWLAGKSHKIFSAIVLFLNGQRIWHHLAESALTMRQFDAVFVDSYIQHIGDAALWSPGAYQIESVGTSLFSEIDGEYFDILGLPLLPLFGILNEHGLSPLERFP
jgi:septum formation protein